MQRNAYFQELPDDYLFPRIAHRKEIYLQKHPKAQIISLGIGDTKLPLPSVAAKAMQKAAAEMATPSGYRGYGPEQGDWELRRQISRTIYQGAIAPEEIFIGDGVKCDIARLQVLCGAKARIGVQDPTYPAYRDSAILVSGMGEDSARIKALACTKENGHFPELRPDPEIDLLFFCSPNNPTGRAATRKELTKLVKWALQNRVVIAFDAAYSWYVRDGSTPLSIFEIEGAKQCALEFNSFSKMAGFTGVRLSWTALPTSLVYANPDKDVTTARGLHADWQRLYSTLFNGASTIAQRGGLACLTKTGRAQVRACTDYYMENAALLRRALRDQGVEVTGGQNAPYLWARFQKSSSWEIFDHLLEKHQLLTTPGVGFGLQGEGYVRLSSLGLRTDVLEAVQRLSKGHLDPSSS